MWICPKCGEKLEEQFGSCWRCSTVRPAEPAQAASETPAGAEPPRNWKLAYRFFRGTLAAWDDLFTRAAYFATELGPERVLNISHSADDGDGVVTVWYWDTQADAPGPSPVAPSLPPS